MTRNETHVHDLSTFANFKDWAESISDALAAFGWIQANDTGQVVWTATVLTLTQVTVGATAVYSYSSFTGPAPRVGMSVIFSGFGTGGNNVTATLTAVSGGASGTVTVVLSTQANETHAGSGTTTANTLVPGSGAEVYEVWQPGDGLQNFYMHVGYQNSGGSTPAPYFIVGTGTNGAGTVNGTVLTTCSPNITANSGVTLFNCLFCGDSGSFAVMMWRDATAAFNFIFAIDRSRDGSGNPYGTGATGYVTAFLTQNRSTGTGSPFSQQSLVFGVGAAPIIQCNTVSMPRLWATIIGGNLNATNGSITEAFNGNTPLHPAFPIVGYFDNPTLMCGHLNLADYGELAVVTSTIYGAPHTFVFSKNQTLLSTLGYGCYIRWE